MQDDEYDHWQRDWPLMPDLNGVSATQALSLGFPPSGTKASLKLFSSTITNLLLADRSGRWVSYSRSASHYERLKQYRPPEYTLHRVREIVDLLLKLALVEEERQGPGRRGIQSRIRATRKLVTSIKLAAFRPPRLIEVVELRNKLGRTCSYEECPATIRSREALKQLNRDIGQLQIAHLELDLEEPLLVLEDNTIVPWKRALRRIFKPDFETCARLYGGFWQQLPKAVRAHLLISGERVAEPDFASLHARILYALHGLDLVGDAYEVPDTPFDRTFIKSAWMRCMNARSRQAAIASLRQEYPDRTHLELDALLEAIEDRHAPISTSLYMCPAEKLQFIDSELLLAVIERCREEQIFGLPIHDSIIVRQSHATRVTEIMAEVLGDLLKTLKDASGRGHARIKWKDVSLPQLPWLVQQENDNAEPS